MYSCGPLHIDEQRQDDQLESTYSSSVPIRDVTLKICRMQWTIGKRGERGSKISVLMGRHDDDIYIYTPCITKVSTPLTFLQIFKYISSWDNTDKMTL